MVMIETFRPYIILFYATPSSAQKLGAGFNELTERNIIDEFVFVGLDEGSLRKVMELLE